MIISTQLTIIRNSLACPKKNLDYSLIIFSMQYRLRFKTKNYTMMKGILSVNIIMKHCYYGHNHTFVKKIITFKLIIMVKTGKM